MNPGDIGTSWECGWGADFTQAVYGPILNVGVKEAGIWPPAFILKMYAWWSETYDPLLAKNPMW